MRASAGSSLLGGGFGRRAQPRQASPVVHSGHAVPSRPLTEESFVHEQAVPLTVGTTFFSPPREPGTQGFFRATAVEAVEESEIDAVVRVERVDRAALPRTRFEPTSARSAGDDAHCTGARTGGTATEQFVSDRLDEPLIPVGCRPPRG